MTACFGSQPKDILAGIGPSICQECYEVKEEPIKAFKAAFGDEQGMKYFQERDGSHYLDLWTANRDVLAEAGVKNIEISGLCTAQNLDDWFSHRAEKGKTGRFAVLMALDDN